MKKLEKNFDGWCLQMIMIINERPIAQSNVRSNRTNFAFRQENNSMCKNCACFRKTMLYDELIYKTIKLEENKLIFCVSLYTLNRVCSVGRLCGDSFCRTFVLRGVRSTRNSSNPLDRMRCANHNMWNEYLISRLRLLKTFLSTMKQERVINRSINFLRHHNKYWIKTHVLYV